MFSLLTTLLVFVVTVNGLQIPVDRVAKLQTSRTQQYADLGEIVRRAADGKIRPRQAVVSPTPASSSVFGNGGLTYSKYYTGSGVTQNNNNPGNTRSAYSPGGTSFAGNLSPKDAIQQCADAASNYSYDGYGSFQIYHDKKAYIWTCIFYNEGQNSDTSTFNVVNQDVDLIYGYSF